ncbi:MAG TPA: hypothetical protein VM754_04730 [Actinomycetota bacterium]|nr:hypothetical protein [Actinomycetota bacterium]
MDTVGRHGWVGHSLRRYLPAEAAGIAVSLAAGLLLLALSGSVAAAALAATWGENAGYYGLIAVRDYAGRRRDRGGRPLLATLGQMLVEFGPAEALDSLLVRPALMFAGLRLASSPAAGIVLGKLAADFVFYAVAITSRQLLNRRDLTVGGIQ